VPTIAEILTHSAAHTALFAEQRLQREEYLFDHPTDIAVMLCIDGRAKLRTCTGTLPGVITPMRSPAGDAHPSWPGFKANMKTFLESGHSMDLFIATFHESGSNNSHLGCAAVNKNPHEARRIADALASQLNHLHRGTSLSCIVMGIDTDDDSLILRSNAGTELNTKSLKGASAPEIQEQLYRLYPDCPRKIREDLTPLIEGNLRVLASRERIREGEQLDHQESVIGIAGGLGSFDWLDRDMALIVSTINLGKFEEWLATAATVLLGNIARWGNDPLRRHLVDRGVVLMSCMPYWRPSRYEILQAELDAVYHEEVAMEIIRRRFPELLPHLDVLTARIDMTTRTLKVINERRR
jgi:hypothetical protein